MPNGHNGPYFHQETMLRCTCHWLITWCHAYSWTGDPIFFRSAQRALNYILLPEHRPFNSNWLHRKTRNRDSCNGLIGPAWTLEALVCATHILESDKAFSEAEEVFNIHPFDEKRGLWKRVEVDGRVLPFDRTFNHQLWFASSAARLSDLGSQNATLRVASFLEKLHLNFSVNNFGLIRHRIHFHWWDKYLESGSFLHKLYAHYDKFRTNSDNLLDPIKRDFGYHAFNLHAFAVLHRFYPQHFFWKSFEFFHAMKFSRSDHHKANLLDNKYACPYNPVGFEMALALQEFYNYEMEERRNWIAFQITTLTDSSIAEYGWQTDDPITSQARLYEAVELDDISI